jgi:hypothetical protein
LQAPAPSKHQPWYTHWSRPLSSTRPSESGARRCGQASSNTRHSPAPRSYQATTLSPSTVFPCGARGSRSHTGARGYHWSSQSNPSAPDGDGDGASSVRGVSAATADTENRAARRCTSEVPLSLREFDGATARGSEGPRTRGGRSRERRSMAVRDAENSWLWSGGSRGRVVAVGRLQLDQRLPLLVLVDVGTPGLFQNSSLQTESNCFSKKIAKFFFAKEFLLEFWDHAICCYSRA